MNRLILSATYALAILDVISHAHLVQPIIRAPR